MELQIDQNEKKDILKDRQYGTDTKTTKEEIDKGLNHLISKNSIQINEYE